jgi:eukaryotic-like serine/threonine-protein kinase
MTSPYNPLFLAVQQALAGRYSLLSELGRGGMGIVYLGHEVRLDRPVAIKVLPPEQDSALRRSRFLQEARAAAQLSHPNIVAIHAVDEADPFVFYAMTYVEGETLRALIERRGPLSAAQTALLMRDVARALGYAHARGVVHRDVKPDNILIERATNRPLVTDFGIAQTASATPTGLGQAIGTPEYMSPEQASGEPVDARTDLYALGAVGYFALTGRPPFSGEQAAEVMARHISEPPPRLASAVPGTPARLARIIDRCLTKDKSGRFDSGELLAEALDDAAQRPRILPPPLESWIRSVDGIRFRHVMILPPVINAMGWGLDAWIDELTCVRQRGGGCTALPPWANRLEDMTWTITAFVLPFVVYAVHRLIVVRRVRRHGFGLVDMRSALLTAVRAASESGGETEPHGRARESFIGAIVAVICVSVVSTCWDAGNIQTNLWLPAWLVAAGITCAPAFLRPPGRSAADADLRVRVRLWSGALGRVLSWLAGLGLPRRSPTHAPTHRPTELALGTAVIALYEALPGKVRTELPGLLETVQLLEAQAGRLRGRLLELDEMRALAESGGGKARRLLEDHHRQLAGELAGRRSVADQQLAAVVTALETLRLDLIRLRAGAVTAASITADLEAARRIGADIDAVIDARVEVAALTAPRG